MFLKGYPLEAKTAPKNWVISDPLIVSKFHNEIQDPKGQENKFYTIVKGRETFYRRHTVPATSCSEINFALYSCSSCIKDNQQKDTILNENCYNERNLSAFGGPHKLL